MISSTWGIFSYQVRYRWLKQSKEIEKEDQNPKPAVDLSLKAGQTITINLKVILKVEEVIG